MSSTKLFSVPGSAVSTPISRPGAWLLVLSPLTVVVQMGLGLAVVPAEFARTVVIPDATRAQVEQFLPSFVALAVIGLLSLVGVVGVWLCARRIDGAGRPFARAAEWCAVVACVLFFGATLGGVLAELTFTTATISESASYWIFEDLKTGGIGWIATLLLVLALRRAGVLRRTAAVMTVLTIAIMLLTAATVLVAPPVLTAALGAIIVWVPLGILLLRRRRQAGSGSARAVES